VRLSPSAGAGLAPKAQAASVDLSSYFNSDASFYTGGDSYPVGGPLTINGVHFDLGTFTGGLGVIYDGTPTTTKITGLNITGNTVFTLINSAFGASATTIGSVSFIDTNDVAYTYNLTEGDNVRDHYNGFYNNTAPNVYGTATFQSANPALSYDRLDAQRFVLPALVTLKEIDFTDNGLGGRRRQPLPGGDHRRRHTNPGDVAAAGDRTRRARRHRLAPPQGCLNTLIWCGNRPVSVLARISGPDGTDCSQSA